MGKNLLIITIILFIIFFVVEIYLSIRLRRSFLASVIEVYLRCTSKRKKHARSKRKFDKYLKRHNDRSDYYVLPKLKFKTKIYEEKFMGKQVFLLKPSSEIKKIVIFLHGGAYISQPLKYHWKFCNQIANRTSSLVVMPIYPLTPKHHFDEAFEFVKELYLQIKEKSNLSVVLMGDSSGGGLALSINMYLANHHLIQPNHLILISPWLDLTMSHPLIKRYEKIDPMLSIKPLKEIATIWANHTSLYDYRISPYFGEVENLNQVSIFVGTREILYPEIHDFVESLKCNEVKHHFYVGHGMNHDYVLYPIKEGKKALQIIIYEIKIA